MLGLATLRCKVRSVQLKQTDVDRRVVSATCCSLTTLLIANVGCMLSVLSVHVGK